MFIKNVKKNHLIQKIGCQKNVFQNQRKNYIRKSLQNVENINFHYKLSLNISCHDNFYYIYFFIFIYRILINKTYGIFYNLIFAH